MVPNDSHRPPDEPHIQPKRDRLFSAILPWGDRLKGSTVLWLVPPAVTLVVLGLRSLGLMQSLELALYDRLYRWRASEAVDDRIVIVGITEEDLTEANRWPIDDELMAQLLQTVIDQEPRAIGLDIYRNLPVPPGTDKLNALMENTSFLFGIEKMIDNCDPPGSLANPWGLRGILYRMQTLWSKTIATSVETSAENECSSRHIPPHPILAEKGQIGFNDFSEDRDGRMRRALLTMNLSDEDDEDLSDDDLTHMDGGEDDDATVYSLATWLSLYYLSAENIQIDYDFDTDSFLLNDIPFPPLQHNDGGYFGTDDRGHQILVNYRGPASHFNMVTFYDVIHGDIPADLFLNRVVLIGPAAASLNDNHFTPFSNEMFLAPERMAGVEIHANVVSQLLSAALDGRPAMRTMSEFWESVLTLAGAVLGAIACWYVKGRWTILAVLLGTGGGLVVVSHFAFARMWWVPVLPPMMALGGAAMTTTGYVVNRERSDRETMKNLFGRHVTAEVAEAIWRDREQFVTDGRLPGPRVTATVLFTDLKDFSTTSEKFDPEALMVWLNEYMEAMTEEVLAREGIVDKFIGDAVMAVFGVPIASETPEQQAENARRAVRCALAMGERLAALNRSWQEQGRPTTEMRVGIATGAVVVGSLGSSQRVDYTTIGDTVNVAARLESYDKSIEGGLCRILIESETYGLCGEGFDSQFIGKVTLKGRLQKAPVYQVLGERSLSERQV